MEQNFDREMTINSISEVSDLTLEPGKILGSRYYLRQFLGRGGMGEVWRASEMDGRDTIQEVVVKIVPPERQTASDEILKIRQSFALVHRLRHPNIAAPLTLANDAIHGMLLIMDFIDGESLAAYQAGKPGKKFTLTEAVEILTPLAAALDYAHEQRIIHRDIKPLNVMVPHHAKSTRHKEVKLIDFDLAAEVFTSPDDVNRLVSATSGTIPYMPPEQIQGQIQGPRSDQYSLAVLAYQMLSGGLPFQAPAQAVLIHQILYQPPTPISGVPERVNQAIMHAMKKNREERFPTCGAFAAALAGERFSGENTVLPVGTAVPPGNPAPPTPPVSPPAYREGWRQPPPGAYAEPGRKPLSELTSRDDINRHLFHRENTAGGYSSHETGQSRKSAAERDRTDWDDIKDLMKGSFSSPWDHFKDGWSNCTDFHSRTSREEFWSFLIIHICVLTVAFIPVIPGIIYGFFGILPCLSVTVRRLRDCDFSGFFILGLFMLPFITFGLAAFIILPLIFFYMFVPGTAGDNRNGPPPGKLTPPNA